MTEPKGAWCWGYGYGRKLHFVSDGKVAACGFREPYGFAVGSGPGSTVLEKCKRCLTAFQSEGGAS